MAQWAKQWTVLPNIMGKGSKPEQLYILITMYYFFVFYMKKKYNCIYFY